MTQSTIALTLGNITIRQQNGLFSLNDLHKAAGGEAKHQPALFMRMEQTQALITEIGNSTDSQSFKTKEGRNGGTYACRELVIAYAAWISAAFHLKVIRVFLAATTRPANPAIDYDRISPAQAQDLKEIVAAIVQAGIQGYGETWARLQRKFKVNSYLELPATQHLEARAYLLAKLPKGDAGAAIEQPAPLPSLDPFNAQAMAAASKQANEYFDAARQGKYLQQPTAIPPEVLCGLLAQAMLQQRFMLSFDRCTGRMNFKPVPDDAYVLSWQQFARAVVTNDIDPSNAELADLASACNRRLAQRLAA
mgnify:FL=1